MVFVPMPLQAGDRKILRVGSVLHSPPYVFQAEKTGIELEKISKIFAGLGFEIEWVFLPPKRIPISLEKKEIDVGLRMTDESAGAFHYSQPYLVMNNIAVVTDTEISLKSIEDLARFNVVAFHRARDHLGPAYREATSKSRIYLELAEQKRQLDILFRRDSQVIVLDEKIFEYVHKLYYPDRSYKVYRIFKGNKIRAAFLDRHLRDRFDSYLTRHLLVP
jgi:polar amino acid transport system substrate-binding protein